MYVSPQQHIRKGSVIITIIRYAVKVTLLLCVFFFYEKFTFIKYMVFINSKLNDSHDYKTLLILKIKKTSKRNLEVLLII